MNNKKGFTLVELLAVIVILALIMGIAVVGIGSVLSTSRTKIMYENALSIVEGVKKQFALYNEVPDGKQYGFSDTLLETGSTNSPLGGAYEFNTKGDTEREITNGLWQIGTTKSGCTSTTKSYISVDANGVYTLCLHTSGDNKYIYGTEKQIASETSSILLPTTTP